MTLRIMTPGLVNTLVAAFGVVRGARIMVTLVPCLISAGAAYAAAPSNDNFADRIALHGATATGVSSTLDATLEPGEPNPSFAGYTIWWSWTAPSSGQAAITYGGVGYDSAIAVYTGQTLGSLVPVAQGFNPTFAAVAGTTYQLQADAAWSDRGPTSVRVTLTTVQIVAPTNGADFRSPATFNVTAAPLDSSVAFTSVGFYENGAFVGTATAPSYQIARTGLPVGAYTYTAGATDAAGITTTSAPVTIHVTPSNDDFADRIPLTGAPVSLVATIAPATSEPGEWLQPTNFHRVWYSWTAPITGLARVESSEGGSAFPYTGTSLQTLAYVPTDHTGVFEVIAGGTYQIGVGSWHDWYDPAQDQPRTVTLHIEAWHRSVNADFADRLPLVGTSVTEHGSNFTFATFEPDEPRHARYSIGRSVWWTWTAPDSGLAEIAVTTNAFDPALGVYEGTSLSGLQEVVHGYFGPTAGFYALAGHTYAIAVDAFWGSPGFGFFDLNLSFTPMVRAANDDFINRTVLTGTNVVVTGSNSAATHEPDESDHAGFPGQRSVWWTWTAPGPGLLTIDPTHTPFNTLIAVYAGNSLSGLVPVASSFFSTVYLQVERGSNYVIALDGYAGQHGNYRLGLTYTPPPMNDDFANRLPITTFPAVVTATNALATREPDEPLHFFGPEAGNHSLWWTWTAPFTGTVTASARVPPNQYVKTVGVYTGNAVNALATVVNRTPDGTWTAQQGVTYHIAVDGHPSEFTLSLVGRPVNDDFANRLPLIGESNLVSSTSLGATLESGEPSIGDPGGRSVWWTWTAPRDGEILLGGNGQISYELLMPLLGVYTGHALANLSVVASNLYTGQLRFQARQGVTYQIQLDGSYGRSGPVGLYLAYLPPVTINPAQAVRLSNGLFQFLVTGPQDDIVVIEASTNLQHWIPIHTNVNGLSLLFTDPDSANLSRRFYRVLDRSAASGN